MMVTVKQNLSDCNAFSRDTSSGKYKEFWINWYFILIMLHNVTKLFRQAQGPTEVWHQCGSQSHNAHAMFDSHPV